MSQRVNNALSLPNPAATVAAPRAEAGRLLFYARADGLYYRKPDGSSVGPLSTGGQSVTPTNMVTTDTGTLAAPQEVTGFKRFTKLLAGAGGMALPGSTHNGTRDVPGFYFNTPGAVAAFNNGDLGVGIDSSYRLVMNAPTVIANGAMQVNGDVTTSSGNGIKLLQGANFGFAGWIDMPAGLSGLGTGGVGAETWIAKVNGNGQFFDDVSPGDMVVRSAAGQSIRLGEAAPSGTGVNTVSTLRIREKFVEVNGPIVLRDKQSADVPALVAGQSALYSPDGKSLRLRDSDGTEVVVGPSSGGGGTTGATIYKKTADQNFTTTALADITDWVVPLGAGETITLDGLIFFHSAAAQTGFRFAATPTLASGPSAITPNRFLIVFEYQTSATAWATFSQTVPTTPMVATTASYVANSGIMCRVTGQVTNGAQAGVLRLQAATEVAGSAITVRLGNTLRVF